MDGIGFLSADYITSQGVQHHVGLSELSAVPMNPRTLGTWVLGDMDHFDVAYTGSRRYLIERIDEGQGYAVYTTVKEL